MHKLVVLLCICGPLLSVLALPSVEPTPQERKEISPAHRIWSFADNVWNFKLFEGGFLHTKSPDDVRWPKFEPSVKVIVATALGLLGAAFASAGGVGGGPLFVPLFNILLGYDAKSSAALSKSMVFGVSVSSIFFNIRLRHPNLKDKPLIDYDIALLLQPSLLLGISFGVISNVVLPSWVLKILLVVLLFFTTYKTTQKGIKTWKSESAEARLTIMADSSHDGARVDLPEPHPEEVPFWKLVKWENVTILATVWVLYFAIQITSTNVGKCSPAFWAVTSAQVVVTVTATLWAKRKLSSPELLEASEPLISRPHSPIYDPERWRFAPFITFLAGSIAGLLGIGGGLVMGPLFLELDIQPQVSSATSAFMVLFSSSMSVVEFYLLGRIPVEVAIFFAGLSMVAAFFGLSIVRAVVSWSKKVSIVVFVLAALVGVSGVIILITGTIQVYSDWITGKYMGLSGFCPA